MKISVSATLVALIGGVVIAGWGCGTKAPLSGFDAGTPSGSSGSSGSGSSSGGGGSPDSSIPLDDSGIGILPTEAGGKPKPVAEAAVGCTNLQCQIDSCEGGAPTTISGTIKDPAGHNPIFNVVAFIPNTTNGALPAIPGGIANTTACSCSALFDGEEPVVGANTDASGNFIIADAPSGKNIPLVIQIGKWRKEVVIANVTACQDNPQGTLTLPKNGSDGLYASLPNIAVSTGGADTLECLLTRVGVDEAEFTGNATDATKHVHVFQGAKGNTTANPAAPTSAASLWDSQADLSRYDITMLSCEGAPTVGTDGTTPVGGTEAQTVADYVSAGGRVFAEHYHYQFFAGTTPFMNTANWNVNHSYTGAITGVVQTTLANGNPFPEGTALQKWLTNVGALSGGTLPIAVARADATVGAGNLATAWVQASSSYTPASTQYFSWDMPFNAQVNDAGDPQYCGRVVFSDLHVSGGGGAGSDYTSSTTVPTGCASTNALSADEDALEFILFDLSSCLTLVGRPVVPPPIVPMPEAGPVQ